MNIEQQRMQRAAAATRISLCQFLKRWSANKVAPNYHKDQIGRTYNMPHKIMDFSICLTKDEKGNKLFDGKTAEEYADSVSKNQAHAFFTQYMQTLKIFDFEHIWPYWNVK